MLAAASATARADTAPIANLGPVAAAPTDSGLPAGWDRKGVFIEILVRAYQDSNGDGIGDLNGVTRRLNYLQSLGIRGIWLMPIFASHDHDHGYAPTDLRDIEPDYGTMADFDRLLAEAHKRGIGVILDYVINQTGTEHPVFKSAATGPSSPYRDWYIFSAHEVAGWDVNGSNPWRRSGTDWFYGVFDVFMPDWNLRNPAVVDFHLDTLRFWLNRGVDGFRFDTVGTLYENGPSAWENQPENHLLMKRVQALLASYGKRYMVCEAPTDPVAFAAADSCGSAFAFGLQKHIIKSAQMGRLMPGLLDALRTMPVENMGTLLSNHDFFAGTRLQRQFEGDEASYKLAAATLLTLPGRPFIYYGEEIGLGLAQRVQHSDQSIRGPMSWDDTPNAGFTTDPADDAPFRPLVTNWRTHNVALEERQPASLLHWYRALIALRNALPALQTGSFKPLAKRDEPLFGFVRQADGEKLLVLINYSVAEAAVSVPAALTAAKWELVFPASKKDAGALPATLAAQSVMVFKAGKST
jgi:glycosidase